MSWKDALIISTIRSQTRFYQFLKGGICASFTDKVRIIPQEVFIFQFREFFFS